MTNVLFFLISKNNISISPWKPLWPLLPLTSQLMASNLTLSRALLPS